MLLEYLEDVGMTYREINLKQNRKALIYLSTRILGMKKRSGLGRSSGASSIEAMPKLLESFFGNLAVLGGWVQAHNSDLFSRSFRRHLLVQPNYDIPKRIISRNRKIAVEKTIAEVKKNVEVIGGVIWLFSEGTFRCPSGKWAGIDFGYWYYILRGEAPTFGVYADFWWRGRDYEVEYAAEEPYSEETLLSFPDETKVQMKLRDCFRKAKKKALKLAPVPYKGIFRKFVVP
jgi:hypothetical protein